MGNATVKPGILEVGSGIGFAIDGTSYLAMVIANCEEETDPRYGVPHYVRYISGNCAREWVWLDVSSKTLTLRTSRKRCTYHLETTGLWRRDVIIPTIAWSTSLLESVRSSRRLCDYLEAEWPRLGLPRNAQILELGAGDGWLGMTVARNLVAVPGKNTTWVTEKEDYRIRSLNENVTYNMAQGLPLDNLGQSVLNWEHRWKVPPEWCDPKEEAEAEAEEGEPDVNYQAFDDFHLLLGADLVVEESSAQHLAQTIRYFLWRNQELTVLLAHQMARAPDAFEAFLKALRKRHLEPHVVASETGEADISSSEPMAGVVIWQITCQKQDQWLLPWSDCLTGLAETFPV